VSFGIDEVIGGERHERPPAAIVDRHDNAQRAILLRIPNQQN
jgi:hypothetical protein